MKTHLKSNYEGVIDILDTQIQYAVLPDGRRLLVVSSSTEQFVKVLKSAKTILKFQDTHGIEQSGIDAITFPRVISTYIQENGITDYSSFKPWQIFEMLFAFGIVEVMTSPIDASSKVNFQSELQKVVK